jgi:hypothetical protein
MHHQQEDMVINIMIVACVLTCCRAPPFRYAQHLSLHMLLCFVCWPTPQVGIKDPGSIAIPSVRNDAAFLASVVGE